MPAYRSSLSRYEPAGSANAGHAEQNGHSRWLVSYADFMTLLMAFFVVMYSISQVSEQKYRVLSETFTQAFNAPVKNDSLLLDGPPQHSHTNVPIDLEGNALQDRPGNDANEVPATFTRIAEQIEQRFESLLEREVVTLSGNERWLEIELPSAVLFDSGGASLSAEADGIIEELAGLLAGHDNVIRVEGFTDDVPISTTSFASNWELSAARAAAVVRKLVDSGIEPARLAATGYGQFQPAHSNSSPEGRSRNRRIVLMVSTQTQMRHDTIEPEQPVLTAYEAREPLPEGALVRGLERSALAEARAWLARRTAQRAPRTGTGDSDASPGTSTSESPAADRGNTAPAASDVNAAAAGTETPGVQRILRDDGSMLFTGSGSVR